MKHYFYTNSPLSGSLIIQNGGKLFIFLGHIHISVLCQIYLELNNYLIFCFCVVLILFLNISWWKSCLILKQKIEHLLCLGTNMEGNKHAVDWTWRNESASRKKQVKWKHIIQKGKGLSFHDSYACKNDCFHNPY